MNLQGSIRLGLPCGGCCPKASPRGRSQDGVLGGRGIHVSTQLGNLPGTDGGPWTPKGTGGTPSDWVGHGGCEGGGEVEVGQDWSP